jgi:hypothetical protein
MTTGKKSTNAEIEERVTTVYRMITGAASRQEILRYGSATWGVTERQVEDYVARATKRFSARAAVVREQELGKAIARFEDLYRKNLKAPDLREAHSVLSDFSKLLGLYEAMKVEHSGTVHVQEMQKEAARLAELTGVPAEEILETAAKIANGVN